jgi:RNA polymerase sigma-70 factor (ECF subfamily)
MIALPASVTTGTRERANACADGGNGASGVWSSLHHAAVLLSLDDASLVACAVGTQESAPDPEAFGMLYERYVHRIYAFAFSRLHERAQAEDITSQTFLQALQALPRYQQRGVPIRYWLFTIAANLIRGLYRAAPATADRLGRRDQYDRALHGGVPDAEVSDPDAEAAIAAGEWAEDFRRVLDCLSPAQRTVIELRFSAGLSIAAIAASMRCTVGAVKALQFRGVQELRRRWEDETGLDPVAASLANLPASRGTAARRSSNPRTAIAARAVRHGSMAGIAPPSQPGDVRTAMVPGTVLGGPYVVASGSRRARRPR